MTLRSMPAVFVHGVPESSAIWSPLIAELGRQEMLLLGSARIYLDKFFDEQATGG